MRPLKVCIDARIPGGLSGGVEQFVLGLAEGLSHLSDSTEQYAFLTHSRGAEWLETRMNGACSILRCKSDGNGSIPAWLACVAPVLRKTKDVSIAILGSSGVRVPTSDTTAESATADVIHFTHQSAFLTRIPSIYHPHDLQHLHLPECFSRRERTVRDVLYRRFTAQAELVAVSSSWVKNDLIRQYSLDPEKVKVVPLAPVTPVYAEPDESNLEATRRKYDLQGPFALYPAQTWPHKNHEGLLKATAFLRDGGAAIPLVCCGRQSQHYRQLATLVRKLRLESQVRFLGFVSPLELRCLYRLSRCVIVPSRFEAASFPLWEAFAEGIPVACSKVTSLPAQAGDGALLFDPENVPEMAASLMRVWSDEDLRSKLIRQGKSRLTGSWDLTARIFRAYYRRIARHVPTDEDLLLLDRNWEV